MIRLDCQGFLIVFSRQYIRLSEDDRKSSSFAAALTLGGLVKNAVRGLRDA